MGSHKYFVKCGAPAVLHVPVASAVRLPAKPAGAGSGAGAGAGGSCGGGVGAGSSCGSASEGEGKLRVDLKSLKPHY